MFYVTYDSQGNLTGSYIQSTPPTDPYISVTPEQQKNWLQYQMSADKLSLVACAATPPTFDLNQAEMDAKQAVQSLLDSSARAKGYDDIVSACSYSGSANSFQAESIKFLTWRAACWEKCYEVLSSIQAGANPPPSVSDLIAQLPALVL